GSVRCRAAPDPFAGPSRRRASRFAPRRPRFFLPAVFPSPPPPPPFLSPVSQRSQRKTTPRVERLEQEGIARPAPRTQQRCVEWCAALRGNQPPVWSRPSLRRARPSWHPAVGWGPLLDALVPAPPVRSSLPLSHWSRPWSTGAPW